MLSRAARAAPGARMPVEPPQLRARALLRALHSHTRATVACESLRGLHRLFISAHDASRRVG